MATPSSEPRATTLRRLRSLRALTGSWALSIPRARGGQRQATAPPERLAVELGDVADTLDAMGQRSLAVLARATGAAVSRVLKTPSLVATDAAAVIDRAVSAVLFATEIGLPPHAAVSLFPVYRAVQHLAGSERVHPADLWWPQSGLTAALIDPASEADVPIEATTLSEFESALLGLMRDPATAGHLRIQHVCAAVAKGRTAAHAQPWLLGQAVFEALAEGLLAFDSHAKRIAPRLLTLARAAMPSGSDRRDLCRDLLFHCAHASGAVAGPLPPALSRVCRGHGLQPIHDRWPAPAPWDPSSAIRLRDAPSGPDGLPVSRSVLQGPDAGVTDGAPSLPSASPSAPTAASGAVPALSEVIVDLPAASDLDLGPDAFAASRPEASDDLPGIVGRASVSVREALPLSLDEGRAPWQQSSSASVSALGIETEGLRVPRVAPVLPSVDAPWHVPAGAAGLALADVEILVNEVESIEGAVLEGVSVVQRLRDLSAADAVPAEGIDALGYLRRLDTAFDKIDLATRRMRTVTAPVALPALIEPVDILWMPAGIDQR